MFGRVSLPDRGPCVLYVCFYARAVCFNIIFHAGATAAIGAYSPGLLTALTLYSLLFYVVSRLAFREGLLTNRVALVCLAFAGLFYCGGCLTQCVQSLVTQRKTMIKVNIRYPNNEGT